jgi:Na+/H+-dicarboxylate symporter
VPKSQRRDCSTLKVKPILFTEHRKLDPPSHHDIAEDLIFFNSQIITDTALKKLSNGNIPLVSCPAVILSVRVSKLEKKQPIEYEVMSQCLETLHQMSEDLELPDVSC